MTDYLPLGTPVHANDTLHRTTEYVTVPAPPDTFLERRRREKRWKRHGETRHGETLPIEARPVDGIVVGVRHLANGWTIAEDSGEVFVRTDGVTAYLIATGLHRAPVLALLEDVTPAPAEPAVEDAPALDGDTLELADGRTVPRAAVDALDELDRSWPGATFPRARGAIAWTVLDAVREETDRAE